MATENTDANRLVVDTLNNLFAKNNAVNQRRDAYRKKKQVNNKELEVALAVILVDLASCDQNFEPQEYAVIQKGLTRLFGTDKSEVSALINQATTVLGNLRGSASYVKKLKDNLSLEERQTVMDIIDDVIESDGVEDGFEVYLRTKFADLLGIE